MADRNAENAWDCPARWAEVQRAFVQVADRMDAHACDELSCLLADEPNDDLAQIVVTSDDMDQWAEDAITQGIPVERYVYGVLRAATSPASHVALVEAERDHYAALLAACPLGLEGHLCCDCEPASPPATPAEPDAQKDAEHFPWHYTEFGVICACGASMRPDESCPEAER